MGQSYNWDSLIKDLSVLPKVYEKANRLMTLFLIDYIRKKTVHMVDDDGAVKVIVDAGSGPGTMEKYFRQRYRKAYIVMLDPLPNMLKHYREKDVALDRVVGVFEAPPLRKMSADLVFAGFSIRDARDILKALAELSRVLRWGGSLVILDLGKPASRRLVSLFLEKVYVRYLPRLVGCLLLGSMGGRLYRGLGETYKRFPYTRDLLLLLRRVLGSAHGYFFVFSTIGLLIGVKRGPGV